MSLQIKWRDGLGNQTEEYLDIDPGNSAGKVEETLSSPFNGGLDRQLEFSVATPTGQSTTLTVNQEGCRQAYVTSDGQRYVTSENQVYGLLKDPCPCPCVPAAENIPASYIILNQNLSDPAQMISGNVNGQAIRWIRCNSHRVVGKSDGNGNMFVCRLNDSNSNYYSDGNPADLTGAQGDVFMRLPRFYYHAEETETDIWKIGFSPRKEADDWKEWDGNDLIGVYKAYSDGTKLYSRSDVMPITNVPHSDFKTRAEATGTGYSLVKWKHHSILAFLFYAVYGNTNSQAICGAGTDETRKITGQTNSLGMTDTVAGGNGDSGSINFWGLENWWGDLYEFVGNVSANNLIWTITEDDDSTRNVQACDSNGFISKVSIGENLDIVPVSVNATDSTGFCDRYFSKSANSLILMRSYAISDVMGGMTYVDALYNASYINPSLGSRLAFRGNITEIEDSDVFVNTEATDFKVSYITLNQNLTDPTQMISGDVNGEAIQWIRDNSHRVLGKKRPDGVMAVCQLDDTNSNDYADGAAADLTGWEGDVFMMLPEFWYHAEETSPDIWKIGFSNTEIAGWKHWDGKDLIGVYKAYSDGTKLYSRSGVSPTTNVSQSDFKARAVATGTGYSLVKFKHHSMLAFLFYAMQGNTDCQAICGSGTNDYPKVTGQTNILGMTDTVAEGNGDSGSINFWGLENWWGDLSEWVDNVSINNHVWTITDDDASTRDVQGGSVSGWISKVYVEENLDMVPIAAGASDPTGFCDYYFQYSGNGHVWIRSNFGSNTNGGVAYASIMPPSIEGSNVGSRLAFRGEIVKYETSSEYKKVVLPANGVYILDTDNNLFTSGEWDTANNDNAVGVAVITDNCKFVISKTQGGTMTWGEYGTPISGIVTTTDVNTAKNDYAGKGNTDKILVQLGVSNAPAANYCISTSGLFPDGRQGYLGSLGEWKEAYNNKSGIDACMSLIGGTTIAATDYYHWTSTQHSSFGAWFLDWSDGFVDYDGKDDNGWVRAFAPLY